MTSQDPPICATCGTQFDLPPNGTLTNCKICDDPRQFVPAAGQSWSTLSTIQKGHKNVWHRDTEDPRVWWATIEPKFGIGQRMFLLQTAAGNVLWDMVALVDQETVDFINSKGGLRAIAISHPHYYTTHAEWARIFKCPIYISADDRTWLCRQPFHPDLYKFVDGPPGTAVDILPKVTFVKTGGHFPGSAVLNWANRLFIADTVVTVPSAYTPYPRPAGQTSYVFMWSIPNMIPMPPDDIYTMWKAMKGLAFEATHGAFPGMEVRNKDVKARMLESMKIQIRTGGWTEHGMLRETLP